jgi:Uma2 family endonuclease
MRFMKATHVTFAELQQWPDDGHRYELYDGEVIVVPTPFPRHQRVTLHLGDILVEYERANRGVLFDAPIDIVFDEHNVVQPDLVYFCEERRHVVKDLEATRSAPDLAVEVVSRSTEARDRGRKMEMLARFGVLEYWIVDPARNTLEIYMLRENSYELVTIAGEHETITSPTLPGLSFQTDRIFDK